MSINNVINEKKKALLTYKEKILDDIKHTERSIEDFSANPKNKCFVDDHADSSDSEDDFATAIDMGPSITQLKLQQAMMKTCLHATQELTSLMVLQSEVDVLVEEPKFERERPVAEAGTWREVTAECRIDLVPFTMTFFMHTPDRKFAPPSYRGLRVVPVKSAHELELSKSVLHSLKLPSDAVEVLRSYATSYRSRRTTLGRLANKYTSALFMEPHAEGGLVLKCADLLEVSWSLENKWSPVAPFHHRMKFDLEFMEESYIKIITQAHKQLLDPALQTDERTLLLAKIVTTCLEARGTIDPESDLESKTTERDNDIDKRESSISESEKRDSEVMAPPKSLPKKGKQKNKDSLANTAQKRSMDDDNGDAGAKKTKNDIPEAKKSIVDANNARKSKMSDVVNAGGKKRKMNDADVNKVTNSKNVKEVGNGTNGNAKTKNVKETDDKTGNTIPKNNKETEEKTSNTKPKTVKEAEDKTGNTRPKNIKETDDKTGNTKPKNNKEIEEKTGHTKPKNVKEIEEKTGNTKPKNVKKETENKTGNTNPKKVKESDNNAKPKNVEDKTTNSNSKPKNMKESACTQNKNTKIKNKVTKEAGDNATKDINSKAKTKVLKKPANIDSNTKSKNKIVKETGNNQEEDENEKPAVENIKEVQNKGTNKEPIKAGKVKNANNKAKHMTTKATGDVEEHNQKENNVKTKNIVKETGNNQEEDENEKPAEENIKEVQNRGTNKEPIKAGKVKNANNKAKHMTTKATGDVEEHNQKENNVKTKNIEKKKLESVANAKIKEITKDTGNPNENNEKENNANTNNIEKQQLKKNANKKSNENIDANQDAGRPKSKITEKSTNSVKNDEININKHDIKVEKNDSAKAKNVANTENYVQTTKKDSQRNINVTSTKNDHQAKNATDELIKNKEKLPQVSNTGSEKTIKDRTVKNGAQTVKKVTENNAKNIRNKDKISQITKVTEKTVKDKPTAINDVPEKLLSSNLVTKKTKSTKNIVKKPIIHKIASHRNSLKPQNPPKILKTGNTTAITTGNTEKENGGIGSKIPQKTLSFISEGSSKKNVLRISPRKIPSKFKTQSQEMFKQKVVKSTNIPRLLKKPAPKTT